MASNRVPPAGATSATTSSAGIVQLTDSTSSTSTTTAATPNAVKSAFDLANGAIPKTLTTTTGDIIYASSANTPARLGIGSTNQVLTVSGGVPSWATPSGSGLVKIGTYTWTGVTTYTISDVFSNTYEHYLLVGEERCVGGGGLAIRLLVSGTASSTSYYTSAFRIDFGGSTFPEGESNVSRWKIGNSNGDAATGRGFFTTQLWYPNQATWTHFASQHTTPAGASRRQGFSTGLHEQEVSYTGLQLSSTTDGNIRGKMTIYGYSL